MDPKINSEKRLISLVNILYWTLFSLAIIFILTLSKSCTLGLGADFNGIQIGEISYYIPEVFTVNEPSNIEIQVRYNSRDKIVTTMDTSRDKVVDTLRIGELMRIELVDLSNNTKPSLTIRPFTNLEQVIDTNKFGVNSWEWKVTPLKPGEIEIGIKSSNIISTNYGLRNFDNRLIKKKIKVQSKFSYQINQFIRKFGLIFIVVISITTWVILYLRTKRQLRKLKIIPLKEFMETESL